ncbi:AIR synthase [Mycolicibacterium litorale]|nr:AIR synthase [Mycolicibacterium litorale]
MADFMRAVAPVPVDATILAGVAAEFLIHPAEDREEIEGYRRLRRAAFVVEQGLFSGSDRDDLDDHPATVILVATTPQGGVLGGVRLAPHGGTDIGWWTGSRLVVDPAALHSGLGPALVRAACAYAETRGVLRFEATVQRRYRPMFTHLGWHEHGDCEIGGQPHVRMRWPIDRFERLAAATKSFLGPILEPLTRQPGGLGPAGFRGDDGVPVPGGDLVAACDAIVPSMVERDPEWAGWCSVLVNVNDLAAMGATPTGLLDAVGAPNRRLLARIIAGVAEASCAWRVPVLGGHTQLGVPAALSVTALGVTDRPVRAGGADVGDALRLTADLTGRWRPGYHGRQWDSSSARTPDELATLAGLVHRLRPKAAKDVSMAGLVGTTGMLAEASGTGAEIDVADICRPDQTDMAAWLSCFPGFAMVTADRPGSDGPVDLPAGTRTAVFGRLTADPGVRLRWPDGVTTTAIAAAVTGLGPA